MTAKIKLNAASGGGSVAFEGPASLGTDKVIKFPTAPGVIVQVVSAVKTDTSSSSSDSFANIPSLSVSITPTASTNKMYVIANVTGSSPNQLRLRLAQDGTAIGTGTADGNRDGIGGIVQRSNQSDYGFQATTMQVLTAAIGDTSSHTFTAQFAIETGGGASYIGRNINDLNNDSGFRASSHITVMEVTV